MERTVNYEHVFSSFPSSGSSEVVQVTVESAIATIDHSDIRGSEPHNRHPSGIASDLLRGQAQEHNIQMGIDEEVSLLRMKRCFRAARQSPSRTSCGCLCRGRTYARNLVFHHRAPGTRLSWPERRSRLLRRARTAASCCLPRESRHSVRGRTCAREF